MNDISKQERHKILKKIIREKVIGDQVKLLEELKKNNIVSTQATISRDFQELGVVKTRVKSGMYRYEILQKVPQNVIWDKLKVLFKNFVQDIRSTENLLLIKTTPGNANGVASYIDRLELREVLGTIAGDDTILLVVDTEKNRKAVEEKLAGMVEKSEGF
ncbi:MAG: arginine repressor [Candidatus Aminicenantes bacterium]|nr:arginine repressor [Candidatus Aminicenantes bacterium]